MTAKGADRVGHAAPDGRHQVGEAEVRLAPRLRSPLAQHREAQQLATAALVLVEHDVVTVARQKPTNGRSALT